VLWPNGANRWLRGTGTVTRDASGKPVRMLGTNTDITARIFSPA